MSRKASAWARSNQSYQEKLEARKDHMSPREQVTSFFKGKASAKVAVLEGARQLSITQAARPLKPPGRR